MDGFIVVQVARLFLISSVGNVEVTNAFLFLKGEKRERVVDVGERRERFR